jgi:hypothetical protein
MKLKDIIRSKDLADQSFEEERITEEEIKRLVRHEIFDCKHKEASEDDLCLSLIRITKCDLSHARDVVTRMDQLGAELCFSEISNSNYDLIEFASLRDYISTEEFAVIKKKEEQIKESRKKIEEKNGEDKSKWSDEAWAEFEEVMEQ